MRSDSRQSNLFFKSVTNGKSQIYIVCSFQSVILMTSINNFLLILNLCLFGTTFLIKFISFQRERERERENVCLI